MFCPNCGHANQDGISFCVSCGKPLLRSQPQPRVSGTPASGSLEASINNLGIKTGPGTLKVIVVASIVGLFVEYGILPFVGIGVLTGYDAGANALLIGFLSFIISFGVAYRMRRGGGRPRTGMR